MFIKFRICFFIFCCRLEDFCRNLRNERLCSSPYLFEKNISSAPISDNPNFPTMVNFTQACFKKRKAAKITTNIFESRREANGDGKGLLYGIDDSPPWILALFLALQHYLTLISAIVSIPFILTPALCMTEDDPAKSYIISTMIFVTAIVTFVQITFGCRLPIVQGGTISFLVPTLAILHQPQWKCPDMDVLNAMSEANRTEVWQIRMREISGAIIVSALVQTIIGYFGIIGSILRFVTPLTIVPTVSLVGLSLFENAAESSSKNWPIAVLTIVLLIVFSLCMDGVTIPMVSFKRQSGFKIIQFPLFKLFPVLMVIVVMWVFSAFLTFLNYFPNGNPARTDVKLQVIYNAAWFRIPYPVQWGWPTYSVSSILGMLAGVLACTVESLGYYPTIAKMCGAPPPPVHAINRGIGTEGLGTVLAGFLGCGNGTNTFGENVGTIGVTKAGSRRIIQFACLIMLLQGVFNKFGALFMIIPEPIIGGIFCVMFGMITAFGLSSLQYIDLNSARNLFILGLTLLFSLAFPKWIIAHPDAIDTGFPVLDNVLTVLFSTSILVGGLLGCILDNLIPGTDQERGLIAWADQMKLESDNDIEEQREKLDTPYPYSTYDFPFGMGFFRKHNCLSRIPCIPGYKSQ